MLHRDERQLHPDHLADFACPEACGIDDMLALDRPRVCYYVPGAATARHDLEHTRVTIDLRALEGRGFGVGTSRAGGVKMSFLGIVEGPEDSARIHNRTHLSNLRRRNELGLDSEHPMPGTVGVQQLPAFGR